MPLATFLLLQGYWGIVKSRLSYKVCVLVEVCTGISSKTSLIRFFRRLDHKWPDLPVERQRSCPENCQSVTTRGIQTGRDWRQEVRCHHSNRFVTFSHLTSITQSIKMKMSCTLYRLNLFQCIFNRLLVHFFCRCLQLPTGGDDFRPTAVFLCGDYLRPLLHDRRRVLDVILDRPQSRKSSHTVNMTNRFNETPWMIQICLKYFLEVSTNNFN